MAAKIKFGTDGWRSKIADDYTFESVKRCTQGFASYVKNLKLSDNKIVVGYDKRFLSEEFAKSAASVLAGNGFLVLLTDSATPTPIISYSVVHHKAIGAVNITASHNPPTDNGFKVRDETGGAIAPEGLQEIERLIPAEIGDVNFMPFSKAVENGKISIFDPVPAYLEHIQDLIDLEPIKNSGLKILVDSMWGNGAGWFPKLLSGGSTTIDEIHNTRNPLFPDMGRPEPIPPNVDAGLKAAKEGGYDVLLINDGDADRFGLGDENGNFINQLEVYGLLAYYLLEVRGFRGPIVKTLSTTSMLFDLAEKYDVPVYETGVGFKYVAPKMVETDAMIGGEESGGFAFKGNVPERDGILAGLYILDLMVKLGKKPSELIEILFGIVGPHYYDRIDRRFTGDKQEKIDKIKSSIPEKVAGLNVTDFSDKDGFKFSLEDGGWLLIRFSGTEPLIRVYCETTHQKKIEEILETGLNIAGLKS